MRLLALCAAALLLAGCATTDGLSGGAATPRPKSIVVSDFVFSPEVVAIDRGYTARLERKIGQYPTFERKQRTLERVNDEIIASIVVTLREAGLEAQPGSEEGLSLNDDAVVITGRLRGGDPKAKPEAIGFGAGRGGVVAEMTLSHLSGGGKKQLANFVAEGAKKPGATPAARNAAIMAAVASAGSPAERLSPDVEAQARALGRAAGDKIVALAREQGWIEKAPETAPAAEPKPAKPPKTAQTKPKPAAKPKPGGAEPKD